MKSEIASSLAVLLNLVFFASFAGGAAPARPPVPAEIKAYGIDFNWGPGGPNDFAKPGLWADADPVAHVAWYKGIGCNVIQTFGVSCNGYAWYKNGLVPEQPGLKHDFLPEMVERAHWENLLVFGYFCAGSNTRWGQTRPALSYGFPSAPHIPYSDEYLAYLDNVIRDAVKKTGMDGFMLDWLRMPTERKNDGGHAARHPLQHVSPAPVRRAGWAHQYCRQGPDWFGIRGALLLGHRNLYPAVFSVHPPRDPP